MASLEAEIDKAMALSIEEITDALLEFGFECTRCGECCKGESIGEKDEQDAELQTDSASTNYHTATIFPAEIRSIINHISRTTNTIVSWDEVARPIPYGLSSPTDNLADSSSSYTGETFEWALSTKECGNCTFYHEDSDGHGMCGIYEKRPRICQTYPFSVEFEDSSYSPAESMGDTVGKIGSVRAHTCEGLGKSISESRARELAITLKERAIRERVEMLAVVHNYTSVDSSDRVVVHDSEGQKKPDGTQP